MSLDEMKKMINDANWFSNISNYIAEEKTIAIKTLEAWRSEGAKVDSYHEYIANNMKWLPTQTSEPDPIHGDSLKKLASQLGLENELKTIPMEIYKLILVSTRKVEDSKLLKTGNHDFNLPAKASIGYAARLAASEIIVAKTGVWCEVFKLFCRGFLPCGILPDGKIVVF